MESSMEVPQKAKNRTIISYDPALPLLSTDLRECKLGYNKDTFIPCLLQHYSQ
jgi:hypothetical protein